MESIKGRASADGSGAGSDSDENREAGSEESGGCTLGLSVKEAFVSRLPIQQSWKTVRSDVVLAVHGIMAVPAERRKNTNGWVKGRALADRSASCTTGHNYQPPRPQIMSVAIDSSSSKTKRPPLTIASGGTPTIGTAATRGSKVI